MTVNQQTNGGQWNLLGTFAFTANAGQRIELTDQANGYVIADAIKLVPEGASPNRAIWPLNPPGSGSYQVFAKWTAHPNRATDAKYTVHSSGGDTTVTVNQQTNGGQWNLLGTFNLDAASTVDLTDQANGYVVADAVRIVGTPTGGGALQVEYLHTDQLGTPRLATNAAGTVIWRWDGATFGDTPPNQDPDNDGIATTINLRMPGQYYDAESGLFYNWNRYYDPRTGRYITSDPIGLVGGLNTNLYASANPLRFVDPLGLCKIQVRYAQILEITGLGYPIKIYHAYLVTTDTDGTQKYFRGGPSGFGIPNWGSIKARYGGYVPGTVDWDPGAPPTDTILNNDSPCGCYNATLEQAAKDLNEAKVPYDPFGPNSNSTANFGLQRMSLGGHRPSVIAPGWSDPLIP